MIRTNEKSLVAFKNETSQSQDVQVYVFAMAYLEHIEGCLPTAMFWPKEIRYGEAKTEVAYCVEADFPSGHRHVIVALYGKNFRVEYAW